MKFDRRALKRDAKAALRAARPNARQMTLLYLLLTSGLSLLVSLVAADPLEEVLAMYAGGVTLDRALALALSAVGAVGLFLNLLVLLFGVVADFGYGRWCLDAVRGGRGQWSDLIDGFAMAGRVILLRLATLAYSLLWYVVIFMPALAVVLAALVVPGVGPLLAAAAFGAALVLYIGRVLRYAVADYCLMDDPDKGAFHALSESRRLMRGRCGEFFVLLLSFTGWQLLSALIVTAAESVLLAVLGGVQVLTAGGAGLAEGIGDSFGMAAALTLASWPLSVWLTPYMTMTQCRFYDRLRMADGGAPFGS